MSRLRYLLLLAWAFAVVGCQSDFWPRTARKPNLPSPWLTVQKAEAAEAAANSTR